MIAAWCAVTFSFRRFAVTVCLAFSALAAMFPFVHAYPLLLALRVVQGLSGGMLPPLLMTAALRFLPPHFKLYGLGCYALTATFGPNLTMPLTAYWTDTVGWPFVYWQIIGPCLVGAAMIAYGIPQDPLRLERIRQMDRIGLLTGCGGMAMLVLGLEQGERLDWLESPLIRTMSHTTALKVAAGAGALLVLTAAALAASGAFNSSEQETDDAFVAADHIVVAPRISGIVARVLVEDNQKVRAGDVIATIDDRDFQSALHISQADLQAAQTRLGNIDARLDRQQSVIGQASSALLAGSAGLQSLSSGSLSHWGSRQFGIGPSLNLPIFSGGRLSGNLVLPETEQQEAALRYQQTVLNAWHDIDDALVAYPAQQRRNAILAQTIAHDQQACDAALARYKAGSVTFLDVLVVQGKLLAAQTSLVRSTASVSLTAIRLYKALGGGW